MTAKKSEPTPEWVDKLLEAIMASGHGCCHQVHVCPPCTRPHVSTYPWWGLGSSTTVTTPNITTGTTVTI